jgi:hypothetical protein
MYSRKLSSLGPVVLTVILGLSLTLFSTNQPQHDRQLAGSPSHLQVADGGAPVPPVPTPIPPSILTADGGAPVPPVPPPVPTSNLAADGGAPVPPVPHVRPITLLADGGAPVPPVPKPPMTTFVAV